MTIKNIPSGKRSNSVIRISVLILVVFLHILVTAAVILFVLSTISILNSRFFHFDKIEYVEKAVSVAIMIISALVFLRSRGKTSQLIRNTFSR